MRSINYQYNIRGWLTDINNIADLAETGAPQDLFAFRIYYNSTSGGNTSVVPLYNGNTRTEPFDKLRVSPVEVSPRPTGARPVITSVENTATAMTILTASPMPGTAFRALRYRVPITSTSPMTATATS